MKWQVFKKVIKGSLDIMPFRVWAYSCPTNGKPDAHPNAAASDTPWTQSCHSTRDTTLARDCHRSQPGLDLNPPPHPSSAMTTSP